MRIWRWKFRIMAMFWKQAGFVCRTRAPRYGAMLRCAARIWEVKTNCQRSESVITDEMFLDPKAFGLHCDHEPDVEIGRKAAEDSRTPKPSEGRTRPRSRFVP